MSRKKQIREFSAWAGASEGANARLVPAEPPETAKIGGAPVIDQSREYVIRGNERHSPEADGPRRTVVLPRTNGRDG